MLIGASDAGAHVQVLSTFDYTTSFLALVREHGGMDVATAVRKLTDVPARLYGLTDRGRIAEGAFADLVVFDPDTVGPGEQSWRDDLPGGAGRIYKEPTGIAHVVVNGTEIVGPEGITGERPGAVLRRAHACLNNAGRVEVSAPGPRVVGRHVQRTVRPHCRAGTPGFDPSVGTGGRMLEYVIAGLVLGGIYAIASAGLVITYTASGILNFAFGAMAFFIARFYYFLHTQQNWSIASAAVVSIGIAGPAMGLFLYAVLFRHLRFSAPLIKVVATIGLLVAIPALATTIFGNQAVTQAPGLAPEPVRVFQFLGVPVTLDQVIVYICVVATVAVGAIVLRFTDIGLKVRAMVDSPAMTDLSGTNPGLVSAAVWAVSVFFAGLTGVLAAPIIGLNAGNYTLLVAAAFAAVIAAKMRSLPIAVAVGLLMGIATSLAQRYLPSNSQWTAEIIDAIPFAVIALVLIYSLARRGRVGEVDSVGGPLDRAITPQGESKLAGSASSALETGSLSLVSRYTGPLLLIVIAAALPEILQGYWVGLIAQVFAYAVIFLSWTVVTGGAGCSGCAKSPLPESAPSRRRSWRRPTAGR